MPDVIIAQIKIRSDSAENWERINPVLATGELGFDTTSNQIRIGNLGLKWTDLVPINNPITYTPTTDNINPSGSNYGYNTNPSSSNNSQQQQAIQTGSSYVYYDPNQYNGTSPYGKSYIELYNLFITNNGITNNLNIFPYNVQVFDHVILYSHLKISQADVSYVNYTLSLLKNIVDDSYRIIGEDRRNQFTSLFINNTIIWNNTINGTTIQVSGPDIISIYNTMVSLVKRLNSSDIAEYTTTVNGEYQYACIHKVLHIFNDALTLDPGSLYSTCFGRIEDTLLKVQLIEENINNIAMAFGY